MKLVTTLATVVVLPLSLGGCASLERFIPFGMDDEPTGLTTANHQLGTAIGRDTQPSMPPRMAEVTATSPDAELRAALAAPRSGMEGETLESISEGGVKISVPSEVCFPYDSARLLNGFTPTLDRVADVLNRLPATRVDVLGYTDNKGSASYNQRLSQQRAQAVADYLSGKGVSKSRIYVDGRGEANPRGSNDSEAGRQLNRRVELIVQTMDY